VKGSLHRDTLRQVARLVHVGVFGHGGPPRHEQSVMIDMTCFLMSCFAMIKGWKTSATRQFAETGKSKFSGLDTTKALAGFSFSTPCQAR